jgi:N-acetylglutamate synthase-like GNAT family acetyltransferase
MSHRSSTKLNIGWCRDPSKAKTLAHFFVSNVEPSYISHSELQFGRADQVGTWAANLLEFVTQELTERAQQPTNSKSKLVVAERDGAILALSLVTLNRDVPIRHAIIEDLVVSAPERSAGIGQCMMDWILASVRNEGMQRVFLESGLSNDRAHRFFERNNFHQVSVVMMADLNTC